MKHFGYGLCLGALTLVACDGATTSPEPPGPTIDAELRRNIAAWGVIPIGNMPTQNSAKVALGQALFFDKILSGNKDISCATCHDPSASLGDGLSLAVGTGGSGVGPARTLGPGREFVPRNAPSLLNSGLGSFYMFWDARLSGFQGGGFTLQGDTILPPGLRHILTAQALLPVLNRREMRGMPGDQDVFGEPNDLAEFEDSQTPEIWQALMARLLASPEYVQMFEAAFPNVLASTLRFTHAAEALSTFQMSAFTKTNSPFDRYLDRDDAALTTEQKRGAQLFFGEAQCVTCHNGPFLGAQSFANVGAPQIGPGVGNAAPLDHGFGELIVTEHNFYKFAFRVAPLRNVELTAPYMHSGAYPTLDAVVRHYSDVPAALRDYDVTQIAPELRGMYHGDDATIADILATLDGRLQRPFDFTDQQMSDLVAFLKSLTDPAARDLSGLVPRSVPSGLSVN